MSNQLLVNFRDQTSKMGATRETLKHTAEKLGVSETTAIHYAVNRLHRDLFEDKTDFDFPTESQIVAAEARNDFAGEQVSEDQDIRTLLKD